MYHRVNRIYDYNLPLPSDYWNVVAVRVNLRRVSTQKKNIFSYVPTEQSESVKEKKRERKERKHEDKWKKHA